MTNKKSDRPINVGPAFILPPYRERWLTADPAPAFDGGMLGYVILITLLALTLRLINLDSGLWYDEIRTLVESVRQPITDIVTVFPGDNQHTFFSILSHISITLFGESAWSLRLPSLLFGTATVPMLYLFARQITGKTEAVAAALLLAVSYHHIWFSQSARGYAMLAFLALYSSWLLLKCLRTPTLSRFVLYGVVAATGIYTHASFVFVPISHFCICLFVLGIPAQYENLWQTWRAPLLGFFTAFLLCALLYAPTLSEVREAVVRQPAAAPSEATTAWALLELLRGLKIGLGNSIVLGLGALIFLLGTLSYVKRNLLAAASFFLPCALTIGAAILLHRPIRPRFLVFAAGFFVLVAIRGASVLGEQLQQRMQGVRMPHRSFALVLYALIAVASVATLPGLYRYPKQDYEGALHYLESAIQPDDQIVTAGGATFPYQRYYRKGWPGVESLQAMETLPSTTGSVWAVYTMESYIEQALRSHLHDACIMPKIFSGTVGSGDITVCRLSP